METTTTEESTMPNHPALTNLDSALDQLRYHSFYGTLAGRIEITENAYTGMNVGPLWGHADEDAHNEIARRLQALYDEAGTDEFDRVSL